MRLKQIRESNNFTHYLVGEKLGIARATYSQWETERDLIPIKRLVDFCQLFDVSVDYCLGFTDIPNYENNRKKINIEKSKERLKKIRKMHKHTQSYIANKFSIDRSLISKYEKGTNIISTTFLNEYIKLYHISGDYLLGKIDEEIEIKEKVNS